MGLVATLVFVTGALAASDDSCCSNAVAQLEAKWQASTPNSEYTLAALRYIIVQDP